MQSILRDKYSMWYLRKSRSVPYDAERDAYERANGIYDRWLSKNMEYIGRYYEKKKAYNRAYVRNRRLKASEAEREREKKRKKELRDKRKAKKQQLSSEVERPAKVKTSSKDSSVSLSSEEIAEIESSAAKLAAINAERAKILLKAKQTQDHNEVIDQ